MTWMTKLAVAVAIAVSGALMPAVVDGARAQSSGAEPVKAKSAAKAKRPAKAGTASKSGTGKTHVKKARVKHAPKAPAKSARLAKCVRAGGSANMITRDLAEFMAKAALKNSIAGMGKKPVGPIKLTCKDSAPVYCLARQKACS